MIRNRLFLLLGLILLAAACASGPQISSVHDDKANFEAMKTYSFSKPLYTEQLGAPAEVNEILKAAASTEMESRGYTYAETDGEIRVDFFIRIDQKEKTVAKDQFAFEGAQPVCLETAEVVEEAPCETELNTETYDQGTLAILAIDNSDNHLLWEGVAKGAVKPEGERAQGEELRKRLTEVVSDIFGTFPR